MLYIRTEDLYMLYLYCTVWTHYVKWDHVFHFLYFLHCITFHKLHCLLVQYFNQLNKNYTSCQHKMSVVCFCRCLLAVKHWHILIIGMDAFFFCFSGIFKSKNLICMFPQNHIKIMHAALNLHKPPLTFVENCRPSVS